MTSLNTALKTIRRSPYQALVAIAMVALTFFVGYSISFVLLAASTFLKHIESQPQIIAFFELGTSEEDIRAVQQNYVSNPQVKEVSVITQEEALALYRQEYNTDPLLLELVTSEILPASIEIKTYELAYLEIVKSELEQVDSIEEVNYQADVIATLRTWMTAVRTSGIIAVTTLAIVSFLSVMVIIALKAAHQKSTISIMRLLGASKGFVKLPFVLEGSIYGLLGSGIAWLLSLITLLITLPRIEDLLASVLPTQVPVEVLIWQLFIGLAISLVLGGLAGFLAVSRFIRV